MVILHNSLLLHIAHCHMSDGSVPSAGILSQRIVPMALSTGHSASPFGSFWLCCFISCRILNRPPCYWRLTKRSS
ncbi:hypothetical protein F4823DRAFT_600175 [Ustulina deusta]|nr:hypothetical protein F4823DRAFT_600175 [Ustulina deusta]